MATRFLFFLLLTYQFWMLVSTAQVGLEEADSFVSVFGLFLKPRGSIILEVPCKSTKRSVFISVDTGGGEGERIIVGRIEEGHTVCSSADSPQTTINIDQTPQAPPSPVSCAGGHDNGWKRECRGGGGKGPGKGGDDPGGDDPGRGGQSDGDEENLGLVKERLQRDELHKLAKISVVITAQTATSLITFPKEKASTALKYVLYVAVGMDICAYIFCFIAVFLRRKKPFQASVMTVLGISCSVLGFLLAMCLIVPANFLWVVMVAFIGFLSSVYILLISSN